MGKRRRRRTRSDTGGGHHHPDEGFPVFEHTPYSFEGQMEQLGHFTRAVNRMRRSGRRPARIGGPLQVVYAALGLLLAVAAFAVLLFLVLSLVRLV
jgi:hypothetical protein